MSEYIISEEQKNLGSMMVLKYELPAAEVKLMLGLAAMMRGELQDTPDKHIVVPINAATARTKSVVMHLAVTHIQETIANKPNFAHNKQKLWQVNFLIEKVFDDQGQPFDLTGSSWSSSRFTSYVPQWAVDMFYDGDIDMLPNGASTWNEIKPNENLVTEYPAAHWKTIRASIRRKENKAKKNDDFLTGLYGDKAENFRPIFEMLMKTGEAQALKTMRMVAEAMKK